jgi:hypothetical protein
MTSIDSSAGENRISVCALTKRIVIYEARRRGAPPGPTRWLMGTAGIPEIECNYDVRSGGCASVAPALWVTDP